MSIQVIISRYDIWLLRFMDVFLVLYFFKNFISYYFFPVYLNNFTKQFWRSLHSKNFYFYYWYSIKLLLWGVSEYLLDFCDTHTHTLPLCFVIQFSYLYYFLEDHTYYCRQDPDRIYHNLSFRESKSKKWVFLEREKIMKPEQPTNQKPHSMVFTNQVMGMER